MHPAPALIALAALLAVGGSPRAALARDARTIHGTIEVPPLAAAPGRLAIWWTEDAPPPGTAWDRFLRQVPRVQVLATGADLGGRKFPFSFQGIPKTPVTVHALVDATGRFWEGHLGGGVGLRGKAPAGDGPLRIALAPPPPREPRPEYCDGPRFRLEHVDAPYVAGALGNPTRRRLCVYLPPSYATDTARRYPVLYLLPGLASTDRARLDGDLRDGADQVKAEAILVAIDTHTVSGSTYFVDSKTSGAWMRFVDAAVAHIDRRFRTDPARRGLIGQSTGGFNAVSLGLRRPDLFSVIGASAPDGLDLEGWLTEVRDGGRSLRPRCRTWMALEAALLPPDDRQQGQFISYAADWSDLQWPADLQTGRIIPEIWARWRAHSPLALLDDPQRVAVVRERLGGRIFLAVATGDEFGLHPPTRAFSARLTALGIDHTFVESAGGHGEGEDARLLAALVFALRVIEARPAPR